MEILWPAVRQYRHNNEDGLVGAYDKAETEKIVAGLLAEIDALHKDGMTIYAMMVAENTKKVASRCAAIADEHKYKNGLMHYEEACLDIYDAITTEYNLP